jgi:hypothetical protein
MVFEYKQSPQFALFLGAHTDFGNTLDLKIHAPILARHFEAICRPHLLFGQRIVGEVGFTLIELLHYIPFAQIMHIERAYI